MGRDVAIVGVGSSDYRTLWSEKGVEHSAYTLAADAYREALSDAGIAKQDVDALLCCRVDYARMADVIGIPHPLFVHSLEGSGRMSGVALQEAAALVSSGIADVVACVYGNNGRSVKMKYGGEGGGPTVAYDEMYGMTSPGAYVAMMYRRYSALYGAPDGALAQVAINQRRNAAENPVAVFHDPLDRDDYLGSRFITEPLRLFDYCMISDGGVALIVTTLERARTLRKRPVRVAASAGMGDLTNLYTSADFFYHACNEVGKAVYRDSQLGPEDMDCVMVYDNFTPTVLYTLEGFEYCNRGEAWQWITDDHIGLHGAKPVNTHGGHTSESYMQGWGHLAEAVRQIRGECGSRQVPKCDVVHYMAAAPITTSHVLVGA